MFPDYRVIPAGGCDSVVRRVNAYKLLDLPHKAVGIIDSDYRAEGHLLGLESKQVYHLPFHEIENFLFCETIISFVIENYSLGNAEDVLRTIKDSVLSELKEQKERWIIRKIAATLREDRFNKSVASLQSYDELVAEYEAYKERVNLEILKKQFENEIDNAISSGDYDTYLKYYDNKGILNKYSAKLLLKDNNRYEEVVFDVLKNHPCLVSALRKMYFPLI